jgi:putative ABC transport system substrate-binding protein
MLNIAEASMKRRELPGILKRRQFIAGLGSVAIAWPLASQAQQQTPVVGYLGATSRDKDTRILGALRDGLGSMGFVEGQNVVIEYRWAEGRYDRLPDLAADLVKQQVAVIFAPASTPAALAAKRATSTIPIIFTVGSDPIEVGLVNSFSRPSGNVTGVSILVNLLSAKRLELLRKLVPSAAVIDVLMNPNTANAWPDLKETKTAAQALGVELVVREASTEREIEAAFAGLDRQRQGALFVLADGFFRNQSEQLIKLAAQYSIPASYPWPEFASAGGLLCYGANQSDAWRQGGVYIGRILRGATPAELPVIQSTKLELAINRKTARSLGLEIPAVLFAVADEVIE